MPEQQQPDRKKLTVEISATLYEALEPYRDKKLIRVADVVQQALESALAEVEQPERSQIARRLSIEKEARQGPYYRKGLEEGLKWAKDVASWKEIRDYASYAPEYAWVTINEVGSGEPRKTEFSGQFQPPGDYRGSPLIPGSKKRDLPEIHLETYWRGWLDGVWRLFLYVANDMGITDEDLVKPGADEYNRAAPTLESIADARREVAEWLRNQRKRPPDRQSDRWADGVTQATLRDLMRELERALNADRQASPETAKLLDPHDKQTDLFPLDLGEEELKRG